MALVTMLFQRTRRNVPNNRMNWKPLEPKHSTHNKDETNSVQQEKRLLPTEFVLHKTAREQEPDYHRLKVKLTKHTFGFST